MKEPKEPQTTDRDMFVELWKVTLSTQDLTKLSEHGVAVRRAMVPEKDLIQNWIGKNFPNTWRNESGVAFYGHPVSCHIAERGGELIGFSVYDAIAKGVAGPLGMKEDFQGKGVGSVLFKYTLLAMHEFGYKYAILGWIPPQAQEFYKRVVGARVIEGSRPAEGMYRGLLRKKR